MTVVSNLAVEPVRVPKTAELVAGNLRRQIITGELQEGDALPPESELTEHFGVSRPTLPSGTATTTYVYDIPLTITAGGPYDMDASEVARWGQQDFPIDATAVFPPDQTPSGTPPSSYERATILYVDLTGVVVNVTAPGGHVTTAEHDERGLPTRTLSAGNRQRALDQAATDAEEAA